MVALRRVGRVEMLACVRIVQAVHRRRPDNGRGLRPPPRRQRQVRRDRRGEIILGIALVPAIERMAGTGRVGRFGNPGAFPDLLGGDFGAARRVERHRERLRGHCVQCAYRFRSAVTGVEKSYLEPPDLVVYQPSNT